MNLYTQGHSEKPGEGFDINQAGKGVEEVRE